MVKAVNFVDLADQHASIRAQIESSISDIIDCSSFIGGDYVKSFEREFAEFIGVREAIGVANGTDALWLSMTAAGIGDEDAVITTPNTFIASVEAITRTGALPVFMDINLKTALLDMEKLSLFLETDCHQNDEGQTIHTNSGRHLAAVMPVHLYGLPVDVAPLLELSQQYNFIIIEDACQAHGARYLMNGAWQKAGSFGLTAGFSFYPAKNLGAIGDGGAIVTDDSELAEKIRWLRDHGSSEKYIHQTPYGWNSRLDAIQAAVLSIKLQRLDEWNALRRQAAVHYRELLSDLPLALPVEPYYAEHVYHLYVVRAEERETLQRELGTRGIHTGLHYPIPLHLQAAYQHLGIPRGAFPNAEQSAATLLSLPMHQAITLEQVERVRDACGDVLT